MDTLNLKVGPVTVDLIADDRICKHILAGKTFEPHSLVAWAGMCDPGTDVIDVGAYSGLFSIAAAKLGARPVAIEPQPVMCERIADNSKNNGVSFLTINAAASEKVGAARLGVNTAVHLTSGASLLRKSGPGLNVRTICLDDLPVVKVSAIKIDVERAELFVLRGAMKLIARDKPKLLIEALDGEAIHAIKAALPAYRMKSFLDTRNMLMIPV